MFRLQSAWLGIVMAAATQTLMAAPAIDFNRDIRSILADKCFACHGPDANKREADLRLDREADAKADRDGSPVIIPGKPDESELLRRLTTEDMDERMPPPASEKTLTPEQIELVRQWIAAGAKYDRHWSLIPPTKHEPPAAGASWARTPIDQFIAAGHERQGFQPSPDADRRTLARRLSFDLLGLPPSSELVERFVNNQSDDAYEQLVDELMASPHYGERMAMYWLDVVRYADSAGYHSDNERDVWPYRDYVIRSFNENRPFDQFTIEQLAGDLVPGSTTQQKIASGFNRLLQTTEEGGAQPKEYAAKYQADRVRNTSVAWLALTMGCCECHDHKYDPLSIRDFYSFAAFFADVQEKAVGRQDQSPVPSPEQEAEMAKLEANLKQLRDDFDSERPDLAPAQAKWEEQLRADVASGKLAWAAISPTQLTATGGTTLTIQDDKSVLTSGKNPNKETYVVTFKTGAKPTTGLRLETLTHDSLANKSLSRANGNFVLTEVEVTQQAPGMDMPQPVKIKEALADFSQMGHVIANTIDGKSDTGWAVNGHEKTADHRAVFIFDAAIPADATVVVKLKHESEFAKHNIGRFRFAGTSADKPTLEEGNGPDESLLKILATDLNQRTAEQKTKLAKYYRSLAPELAPLRQQIAQLEQRKKDLEQAFPRSLITVSVPPRTVRILARGNWLDDSGDEVHPALPTAMSSSKIENRQQARLELARWFVSRDNPLTARVFVNRVWKLFFGQGIVKTLDDFGLQGASPTHPELLDWLAIEFIESGWNVKQLVKQLVMSRTYQQSSGFTPLLRERDPLNQWLARQSIFRLDAEMVRDNALAISGLLSREVGGRSVKPYQPAGYWRFLNFPVREWANDHGTNQYRRGMYTHWQRTFLHPSLLAFDAPSREECTVERPRSNTPLQALVLLNDPTYVEAARVFALRIVKQGGSSTDERLVYAYRQSLNRTPTDQELVVLRALVDKHRAEYSKDIAQASLIQKVGDSPPAQDTDPPDLATWTSVARVILNLHETITRS
jgi:mono/diheme cytochrome c family protein